MQKLTSRSEAIAGSLASWLVSAQGRQFCSWEQHQIGTVIPRVLGYRLLQIGDWDLDLDALGSSAILHHWVLSAHAQGCVQIVGCEQQLPIASRSVDAVLLPHSLELAGHPHALLREVDRVLCDRGQIILTGFNPVSLWHVGQYLPLRRQLRFPVERHFYTSGRVCDWLGLLDYEIETLSRFGAVFPWAGDISQSRGSRHWLASMGQAYMIFARKRVVPLTPARQRWRSLPDLGGAVLPEARVHREAA